ncbi:MAG: fumarate hydratase C-terminal domain-containing protein [Anaerolineales bacterium]|uniref:Fumarate hydratase C-terminal domain-containing protein n=1 Tax=Candidatus Desulfolinea nitratireducens TaxID=2841698 RepID=A0A8J6TEW3_9CHLR|nr:fumarate hydratase C-terminal domain-containing protein [Candidatus Desulfolinea nitratireducens]MBL6960316.1 fumarate hydratase C-terminal domain-containing protein [Anaerolineales bacterium]
MKKITIPISDEAIRELKVGDSVLLSGVMLTGRDAVHKWMNDTFITKKRQPVGDDLEVFEAIKPILDGGIIYHCGPVVSGVETGDYKFVAAGPTTSIREEPYQALVMEHFNIKGVIGKGGMGAKTLKGCQDTPAVYFHAIGGAASLIAQCVQKVLAVHKLDFGVPEAIWVIDVKDFLVVVTMDSHGGSQHAVVEEKSQKVLDGLIKNS